MASSRNVSETVYSLSRFINVWELIKFVHLDLVVTLLSYPTVESDIISAGEKKQLFQEFHRIVLVYVLKCIHFCSDRDNMSYSEHKRRRGTKAPNESDPPDLQQ